MDETPQDRTLTALLSSLLILAFLLLGLQFIFLPQQEKSTLESAEVIDIAQEDEILEDSTSLASNALETEKSEEKKNVSTDNEYQSLKKALKSAFKKIDQEQKKTNKQIEEAHQDAQTPDEIADAEQIKSEQNLLEEAERIKQTKTQYTGLSSYTVLLYNRKIVKEFPPIYKCRQAGKVTIAIKVDRSGQVQQAQCLKNKDGSEVNECLKEAALESAYKTQFNIEPEADYLQKGKIIFIFTSQR